MTALFCHEETAIIPQEYGETQSKHSFFDSDTFTLQPCLFI